MSNKTILDRNEFLDHYLGEELSALYARKDELLNLLDKLHLELEAVKIAISDKTARTYTQKPIVMEKRP